MSLKSVFEQVDHLVALADTLLGTKSRSSNIEWVDNEGFAQFRSAALSFLRRVFGENHPYFKEFDGKVNGPHPGRVTHGRGILNAAATEIRSGWLASTTQLLSAEIFSDFLEMADHLLDESYKDPAAVLCGGALEEHLRKLASSQAIEIGFEKDRGMIFKKADQLNSDLAKGAVYHKLDQKSVTAWLDLRNKAAHGRYSDYTPDQVRLMVQGVRDFITRNPLGAG